MRLRLGLLLTLLCGCGAGDLDGVDPRVGHAESAVVICPEGPTVEGIDVSAYQPNVAWPKVKAAGRQFAIIKATEGTGYVNDYFESDWKEAKAAGLIRGAYHYFHADTGAQAQADHFLSVLGPLGPDDLPAVLDFEHDDGVSDATAAQRAKQWLEIVEAATGKRPILYTYPNFWNAVINSPDGFTDYPLWIANYGVSCPDVPGDWKKWPLWQYSSTGNVSGVSGDVDMNKFNGTLAELKAFASGGKSHLAQVSGNDAMTLVDSPTDARVHLFLASAGGELVHASSAQGKQGWSELEVIGDGAACGSAAAFAPKPLSRAEVFSPGADGGPTQHSHQADAPWTDLEAFGGQGLAHLSTLVWPDGHVEVFALGGDGTIHHKASQAGSDEWADWESLGGEDLVTGASPILWGDGHAELFATDASGVVWHSWSGDFPGGWHAWEALEGKAASRPVPVRWPDGHLEVFARGDTGELVHSEHDGSWQPLGVLGEGTRIAGEPSAIMNPGSFGTAGPEIVARDEDGRVLHMWRLGDAWGDWSPHFDQRVASDPFLWVRADGHAELLAVDPEGRLVSSYHAATGWTAWEVLASEGLDPCAGDEDEGNTSSGGVGSSGGGPDDDGMLPEDFKGDEPAAMDGGCSCRVGSKTPGGGPGGALGVMTLASLCAAAGLRRRSRARAIRLRAHHEVATALAGAVLLLGCAGSDPVGGADGSGGGGSGGESIGGGGEPGSGASDGDGGSDVDPGSGGGDGCAAGLTCVDALPFDDERDTSVEGSQLFDAYACKATADESGPEIVYRIDVPEDGTLTVTVTDGDGVDIDVHVLTDLDAAACVARADVTATAAVTAGVVYVVADTYVSSGVPQAGAYQLAIKLAP